jgi:DNA-binding CsgD family transcriptional regulator
MFTQAEAEVFVKELLEDVFPNGKIELLDKFYALDVVGHFDKADLSFNDIENRVIAIKNNTQECCFIVQEVLVIDQIIALSCKQSWTNKSDGSLHDSLVFVIYRIKNRKISELWGIVDAKIAAYQKINEDFEKEMRPFDVSEKNKAAFLQRLATMPQLKFVEDAVLSTVEKECLYYYLHGSSAKETALILKLSPRTVETYLAEVKQKLQCHTKNELRKKLLLK